jgi:hypothetical protein
MGKMNLTDEQKQERSERMRRLHAEGKAGPQFGKLGGRPKKTRISELLVEEYQKEARKLKVKLDELLEDESPKIRLDTIKHIVDLEEKERKVQVDEEVRYDQLKHAELVQLVLGNLAELVGSGSIDLGDIIDVEAVEVRGTLGTGEGNDGVEEAA